jgi:hypothetical protein
VFLLKVVGIDRYTSNEKAFFTMAYNKYTIDLESITFEVET